MAAYRRVYDSRHLSSVIEYGLPFTFKELGQIPMESFLKDVQMQTVLCTVKKEPEIFSYNSSKNCQVLIIFGRYINNRLRNHKIVYFPTSPK